MLKFKVILNAAVAIGFLFWLYYHLEPTNWRVKRDISDGEEVFGGRDAIMNEFPFMVRLEVTDMRKQYDEPYPKNIIYFCGGSLLSNKYVASAKHCLYNKHFNFDTMCKCNPQYKCQVVLNNYDTTNRDGAKIIEIKDIHFPPGGGPDSKDIDMMVIELSQTVDYHTNDIRTIQIYNEINYPNHNTWLKAPGWGYTRSGQKDGKMSNMLQVAELKLLEDDNAIDEHTKINHIFTPVDPEHPVAPCHGDSGGPLIYYGKHAKEYLLATLRGWGYDCKKDKIRKNWANGNEVWNKIDMTWLTTLLKQDWFPAGGNQEILYKALDNKATFEDAKIQCRNVGAVLAELGDSDLIRLKNIYSDLQLSGEEKQEFWVDKTNKKCKAIKELFGHSTFKFFTPGGQGCKELLFPLCKKEKRAYSWHWEKKKKWLEMEKVFNVVKCASLGDPSELTHDKCKKECERTKDCTAINVKKEGLDLMCHLWACPLPIQDPDELKIDQKSFVRNYAIEWTEKANIFNVGKCPSLGNHTDLSHAVCMKKCDQNKDCTAINVKNEEPDLMCDLRNCHVPLQDPDQEMIGWKSFVRNYEGQPMMITLEIPESIDLQKNKVDIKIVISSYDYINRGNDNLFHVNTELQKKKNGFWETWKVMSEVNYDPPLCKIKTLDTLDNKILVKISTNNKVETKVVFTVTKGRKKVDLEDFFWQTSENIFNLLKCPEIKNLSVDTDDKCKRKCLETRGCTAINVIQVGNDGSNLGCSLLNCPLPVQYPESDNGDSSRRKSYFINFYPDDEVIFITGGYGRTAGTSSEILDVTDPSSPCSRSTGILETPRHFHSLDYLDNSLIMCGGRFTRTSCVVSNSGTEPWEPHSTTNSPRYDHASAVAAGKLNIFGSGGRNADMQSMETLEPTQDWTPRLPLPYRMSGSCAVQLDLNTIIVTGGAYSWKKMASWDALEDKWDESLHELKTGRAFHGCGVIPRNGETFVIVAGGFGSDWSYLTSSELYDVKRDEWTLMGNLQQARWGGRLVTVMKGGSRRLFMVGGRDDGREDLDTIEELDIDFDDKSQSKWSLSNIKMSVKRGWFGAVAVKKSKFCE